MICVSAVSQLPGRVVRGYLKHKVGQGGRRVPTEDPPTLKSVPIESESREFGIRRERT